MDKLAGGAEMIAFLVSNWGWIALGAVVVLAVVILWSACDIGTYRDD